MRYPHHWISEEMSQPNNPHPHWWREIKASRKLNIGAHVVHEGHDDFLPNTMPYGRWQALGCQWCYKRHRGGGMPYQHYKGFVHRAFFPLPLIPEFLDHLTGEDPDFSQGTAGLCRGIQSQARHHMWSHWGAPTMHGPIDDHQWR